MDHRQTPCADSDFSGYSDKPAYAPVTGEHKIPWPPQSTLHKQPADTMYYLLAGMLVFMWFLVVVGFVTIVTTVVRWLF
jgi:hypothetical protein